MEYHNYFNTGVHEPSTRCVGRRQEYRQLVKAEVHKALKCGTYHVVAVLLGDLIRPQ